MKVNQAGIKLLHEFESCELEAYLCPAGVPTIGWGNTFYEDGSTVRLGDKINQERADSLFDFVLKRFEEQAERAITSNVNENQFSAFTSALYNIGPGSRSKDGLIRLKSGQPSTLLKKININPNDPSIEKEFMKWINIAGIPSKGLKRRRTAESKLYFS